MGRFKLLESYGICWNISSLLCTLLLFSLTVNKPLKNPFKTNYPIVFQNLKCDESHFNFNHHDNHSMSDSEYVNHMISHHNTALEL